MITDIKRSLMDMGLLGGQRSVDDSIARGNAARDSKAWADAVTHYSAALEREPHHEAVWVQLGHCLKEGGELAQAEQSYRRALEIDAENADTFLQLGHLLKLAGRKGEAIGAYAKAHDLDPDNSDAIVELQMLRSDSLVRTAAADRPAAPEVREFRDLVAALKSTGADRYFIFESELMQPA